LNKNTKEEKLCTEELMKLLENSRTLDDAIENNNSITNPDTSSYLSDLLIKHNMTIQQVFEKAVISRSFGYQIFNGLRCPNRNVLLRIAIVMKLSLDETQHLLKISQRGELYPKVRRDAAIIFCIKNKCDLTDTDELLESISELSLM
jgi:transcriptional regulator with XRE-family HTH domain